METHLQLHLKHIYTLTPINKYRKRSKNVMFKPLCKKNLSRVIADHTYGINLLPQIMTD